MRIGYFLVLAILCLPWQALGQERPRWLARAELGTAGSHGDAGASIALRAGGRIDPIGVVRADVGFTYSIGQDELRIFELELEVRPLAFRTVTPVLGVGLGHMDERFWSGGVTLLYLGVDARVESNVGLRLAVKGGAHGGEPGPFVAYAGFEYAFGGG